MRHLYLKIYLTVVASLVAFVLVSGAVWRFAAEYSPANQAFEIIGEVVAAVLPPADAPREVQQREITRLADQLGIDIALYDSSFELIAAAGRPLPPPPHRAGGGWFRGPRGGPAWSIPLPDDRWIVARAPPQHRPRVARLLLFLGVIALVVTVCAYPVVRGLTRRLERLQTGVETLGAGDLTARVKVRGRDEVARLAESFNRAAARIEELVGAHRLLLANASHELRTPLSRIRLGIELYQHDGDPKYKEELARDIAELESLIDEILLASRLDATRALQVSEEIDLLALAAEECARYDACTLDGESVTIVGDPRLLRRMIRNLLENAQRHGTPPIEVTVRRDGALAVLDVTDAGQGVPEAERERVFVPFHRLGKDATGAGLGLSLVRQIARLHGGNAVVAPRGCAASCFRVTLPAKDENAVR
jgi:signal transduction histidine kinase